MKKIKSKSYVLNTHGKVQVVELKAPEQGPKITSREKRIYGQWYKTLTDKTKTELARLNKQELRIVIKGVNQYHDDYLKAVKQGRTGISKFPRYTKQLIHSASRPILKSSIKQARLKKWISKEKTDVLGIWSIASRDATLFMMSSDSIAWSSEIDFVESPDANRISKSDGQEVQFQVYSWYNGTIALDESKEKVDGILGI